MKKTAGNISNKDNLSKEWERQSNKYKSMFEKEEAPQIIADYFRESSFALKAPWVIEALMKAFQDGRCDFLEKATAPLRDRRQSNENANAIKSLWVVIEVDRLKRSGMTKNEAFRKLAATEWGWSFDSVKNRYYRWRKKEPEVYVEEKNGYHIISVSPTRIDMNGESYPGRWELITPPDRPQKIKWTIYYPSTNTV